MRSEFSTKNGTAKKFGVVTTTRRVAPAFFNARSIPPRVSPPAATVTCGAVVKASRVMRSSPTFG